MVVCVEGCGCCWWILWEGGVISLGSYFKASCASEFAVPASWQACSLYLCSQEGTQLRQDKHSALRLDRRIKKGDVEQTHRYHRPPKPPHCSPKHSVLHLLPFPLYHALHAHHQSIQQTHPHYPSHQRQAVDTVSPPRHRFVSVRLMHAVLRRCGGSLAVPLGHAWCRGR